MSNNILTIFKALKYAANKHKNQRRAGYAPLPYINHLIKVTDLLLQVGISDEIILQAALLHDVVEDTDVTVEELSKQFNLKVASIVEELTDDMELAYEVRKQLQVDRALSLSKAAKIIRIADKITNMQDIGQYPIDWSLEKKKAYVKNSVAIVNQIRNTHPILEQIFDETVLNINNQLNQL